VLADAVWPWRCVNEVGSDRRHVLLPVARVRPFRPLADPNPFLAFDSAFVWSELAGAHGFGPDDRMALVRDLDQKVRAVDGRGFVVTPFARSNELSDSLGFAHDGGVWVKDETNNVSGSHKVRHLVTILLHLLACERLGLTSSRPSLAIASCGNAALAAATLAAAVQWPLSVFVPPHGDPWVLDRIRSLGGTVVMCPRLSSDPPGDPCVHRFREAVTAGAIPFAVQGPENALCLDGGRTILWEITEELGAAIDRIFVQIGGGALAASVGLGCVTAGLHPRLHAVQAAGCAPFARAWERSRSFPPGAAATHWSECMWPWESEPVSRATVILDDETYDWLGVVGALERSAGSAVVASEDQIEEANELARRTTGIDVDYTGSAGLAGLLALRKEMADDERVVVLFTGVRRPPG
jgi:threonine synthase